MRDRAEHLLILRGLQDETGGFLTYIPLAYHPDHNALGEEMGWTGRRDHGHRRPDEPRGRAASCSTTSRTSRRTGRWSPPSCRRWRCISAATTSRAPWSTSGSTTRPARARRMELAYDDLVRLIRGAGKVPVERDLALRDRADLRLMRLGRIGYVNCYPVYGAMDRGVVPPPADARDRHPGRAERPPGRRAARRERDLRRGLRPATRASYELLPDLAISSDGPVRSVLLFSRRPARGAGRRAGARVRVAPARRWQLLELLARDRWRRDRSTSRRAGRARRPRPPAGRRRTTPRW